MAKPDMSCTMDSMLQKRKQKEVQMFQNFIP